MGNNNAKIPDIATLIQAGIDPRTFQPSRMASKGKLFEAAKRALRIIDEQDAVNRYVWYNLPSGVTSQELERMLYYKGQLCFFYYKEADKFFFMPYALDGTLDFYQRYNRVHPVPMTEGGEGEKKSKSKSALADLLSEIKLDVVYGIVGEDEKIDRNKSCVLLHDYTKQLSQIIIPRCTVNDDIIDYEAQLLPLSRTALIASSGIRGVRAPDADSSGEVRDASRLAADSAIAGELFIPIIGKIDLQELTGNSSGKVQDYFLALQSVDNFRLSTYGLDNGGLFEKKAHVLESEQAMNQNTVGRVLQDGLSIRQNFCNIVNSIFDLGIWCEPGENASGADVNGDGVIYDRMVEGAGASVPQEGNEDE